MIRESVRETAQARIAPFAAEVDERAHDVLVVTDFFAPHVPQEYGGSAPMHS